VLEGKGQGVGRGRWHVVTAVGPQSVYDRTFAGRLGGSGRMQGTG